MRTIHGKTAWYARLVGEWAKCTTLRQQIHQNACPSGRCTWVINAKVAPPKLVLATNL